MMSGETQFRVLDYTAGYTICKVVRKIVRKLTIDSSFQESVKACMTDDTEESLKAFHCLIKDAVQNIITEEGQSEISFKVLSFRRILIRCDDCDRTLNLQISATPLQTVSSL